MPGNAVSPRRLEAAMSAVGRLKEHVAGYEDDVILASIRSETNALDPDRPHHRTRRGLTRRWWKVAKPV